MQFSLKTRFAYIFKVSRPRFWLYLAGPVLLGVGSFIDSYSLYMLLYFLFPANVFLYGVNDIFDQETDALNAKKGLQETRIRSETDKKVLIWMVLVCLVLALPIVIWGTHLTRILLGAFFLLSFFYSAPPLRFKARPFIDSISNMLYIVPGVIAYVHVNHALPPTNIIIAVSLWTWAMHLFSAIPDIAPDVQTGIKTTAVVLGKKKSLLLCAFYWGLGAYALIPSGILSSIGVMYASIPLTLLMLGSKKTLIEKVYWKFPLFNALVGFGLYIYSILQI
jgi:lycopene elongase/hydratase (dihydrobisanhydrobacterioruberin-forming)